MHVREEQRGRLLHPELPFVAQRAAIELDRILTGKEPDVQAIVALRDQLRSSIDQSVGAGEVRSLMDPTAADVVGRALYSASRQQVTDLTDLAARTLDAVRRLESLSAALPDEDRAGLTLMRDFCMALSRYASAYLDDVYSTRPRHPYRR